MSYAVLKKFVLYFLLFYFCAGIFSYVYFRREVYPFFSWFVYTHVPNTQYIYTLLIHQSGDKKFDPPLKFEEAKALLSSSHPFTQYQSVIQELGRAFNAQNTVEIESHLSRLENYFVDKSVLYEVVRIKSNPIDLWNKKENNMTERVGIYTKP